MPRKIYDIKPPKVAKKLEKDLKEFLSEGKPRSTKKAERKKRTRRHGSPLSLRRSIIVGASVLAVIIGVFLFFKLPKADVVIWPKVDTLSFQQTINAGTEAEIVDMEEGVIPAKLFQGTKTNSQDFPATGNASDEGKASGTIIIYNKYDPPGPLTLRAGTHFLSDSGKLFVAPKKVVVPAAKKSGGKITPGSVEVRVEAVEGGTGYNIAPASFSVPGLKGTAYYYSIYAESKAAMSGGYASKVKKVTDDDIQGAKDSLSDKTVSDAINDLKSRISSDYVLIEDAIKSNIKSASTQTKSGTVAENFNFQATAEASAIAFKKSDLVQFAKNYVISQMPQGKILLEESFKVDFTSNSIDVLGGKIALNIDISSGIYQSIDKNSITLSLLGENKEQIERTLKSSLGDQITQVKIKFWPFWVFSAPRNQKAVDIKLNFK